MNIYLDILGEGIDRHIRLRLEMEGKTFQVASPFNYNLSDVEKRLNQEAIYRLSRLFKGLGEQLRVESEQIIKSTLEEPIEEMPQMKGTLEALDNLTPPIKSDVR